MDNKIDLVVSFDTTGSMYPVISQVKEEVEQFVKDTFTEFTDLRLGVITHGDYCDEGNPYTIRAMDLTRNEKELCKFIRETKNTYGGDADECYELVLNTARDFFTWRKGAQRVLIMIGDAAPHSPGYPANKEHLDWREEADKLYAEDIKVFAVHALSYYRSSSKAFYKTVAEKTGGVYLTLDQFNEIVELIKATCYQQGGEEKLNEYISIIRDEGLMTNSMDRNIKRLLGQTVEDDYVPSRSSGATHRVKHREPGKIKEMEELVPVMPGRFQVMTVNENCDIKGFVTKNGIEFKKGRGFYELSKAETVQQYKEVIMQDRETGEMFTGSQVREKLGLQPQTESGGAHERLHAADAKEFRVFVQSTSVNRKLIAGTTFLYEISDIDDVGTVVKETPAETKAEKSTKAVEKKSTATKKKATTVVKKSKDTAEKSKTVVKKSTVAKKSETAEVKKSGAVTKDKEALKAKKELEATRKYDKLVRAIAESTVAANNSSNTLGDIGHSIILRNKPTKTEMKKLISSANKLRKKLDKMEAEVNKLLEETK